MSDTEIVFYVCESDGDPVEIIHVLTGWRQVATLDAAGRIGRFNLRGQADIAGFVIT